MLSNQPTRMPEAPEILAGFSQCPIIGVLLSSESGANQAPGAPGELDRQSELTLRKAISELEARYQP